MVKNKKSTTISLDDIFVSTVIVANGDTQDLATFTTKLSTELAGHYTNYEILIVDNGISQGEVTHVTALLGILPCIRIIRLSRRSSYDTAIFAGLESAIGDFVCTLNPGLDPVGEVADLIKRNQQIDVVQGVSRIPVTGAPGTHLGRHLFYWYNRRYLGIDIPLNATYFMAYSRRVVNALTSTNRADRHVRHYVRLIGYKPEPFPYTPRQNPGNQRSMRTSVVEALEIVTSYSAHPLRFVTWLGVFAGGLNIVYAAYVIIVNVVRARVAEGWTTTSLQLSGMFFVLFVIMVILAEYVGRILAESRKDQSYFVADELSSIVSLADASRRNITR
jgi:glycosyltransferase involved in cell wall biosynthesis